jgi:hypothetical protein
MNVDLLNIFAIKHNKILVHMDAPKEWVGPTDYIDKIPYAAVKNNKLIYGKDHHGRDYFAFGAVAHDGDGIYQASQVIVAFKRYTNDTVWVCSKLSCDDRSFEKILMTIAERLSPTYPREKYDNVYDLNF